MRRFTLIELLVVIAIIAVLAAMLLPALGSARYRAKETVCVNNNRQIVLGLTSYANDFDTWYPARNKPSGTKWPSHLSVYGNQGVNNWDLHTTAEDYLSFPTTSQCAVMGAGPTASWPTTVGGITWYQSQIIIFAGWWNNTVSMSLQGPDTLLPLRAGAAPDSPLSGPVNYRKGSPTQNQLFHTRSELWKTALGSGNFPNKVPWGYEDGSVTMSDRVSVMVQYNGADWRMWWSRR